MFRLCDNTPSAYSEESRDFQLFCRLYDSIFCGVKYSSDSLQHSTSTMECNNTLLSLLGTKLGLFDTSTLSDTELRYILSAYPYIIKYKGSIRAIKYIINVFKRIMKDETVEGVLVINNDDHTVNIKFSKQISNDKLLIDLLSIVIPTGYLVYYSVDSDLDEASTVGVNSKVEIIRLSNGSESFVVNDSSNYNVGNSVVWIDKGIEIPTIPTTTDDN